MNETVYILLPVHKRREITRRFVECLRAQTFSRFHLVLVDDGSEDGTAEMVRDQIPSATVLRGKGDWWWAGSLQQGYNWLLKQNVPHNSIVLIINDDTVFEPEFLEKATAFLADWKKTLLLACHYSLQDGRLIDAGLHIDWKRFTCRQAESSDCINCCSTRGLFLRFSDFMEIGGFFPKLLPHYYSDYEFTIRAYRKGFRLLSDPAVALWGDESSTGAHSIELGSTWFTLKKLFSIKTIPNPIVMTSYIMLACPFYWIPLNLARMWLSTFMLLRATLVHDIQKHHFLRLL